MARTQAFLSPPFSFGVALILSFTSVVFVGASFGFDFIVFDCLLTSFPIFILFYIFYFAIPKTASQFCIHSRIHEACLC